MRIGVRGKLGFRVAAVVVAGLLISSEGDAVMLEWMGKKKVVNHHNEVPFHVLERKWSFGMPAYPPSEASHVVGAMRGALTQRTQSSQSDAKNFEPCRGVEGVEDWDGRGTRPACPPHDENMVIHGDNLLALKSLLPRYEGKIKCIYIDPPYNTGNEGWCYNDNVNDPQMKAWLGKVVGKEGEDFSRHDKWLCMMYPRLKLLQKLLADDGAIFISIDDNEQANLKLVCDEIFGSRNFLATFTWKSRAKPSNTGVAKFNPQNDSEFVVCYSGGRVPKFNHVTSGRARSYPHADSEGRYRLQTILKSNRGENKRETMTFSLAGYTPPATKRWQAGEETIKDLYARNRITFETGEPMLKYYEHEENAETAPFWCHVPKEVSGTAEEGKTLLNRMLGNTHGFDTVKPLGILKYIFEHTISDGDVVLDSFAGSASTAHALLEFNKEHKINARFILIELGDYAERITAERVKKAIAGYSYSSKSGSVNVEGTGGSFGYYELGPELMKEGVINEEAGEAAIREYVWYTETKGAGTRSARDSRAQSDAGCAREVTSTTVCASSCDRYLLGTAFGVAYYFCYEKGAVVTLNRSLLKKIKTKAESYVIYADICTLSAAELEKYHITFKKIPRDITRF